MGAFLLGNTYLTVRLWTMDYGILRPGLWDSEIWSPGLWDYEIGSWIMRLVAALYNPFIRCGFSSSPTTVW